MEATTLERHDVVQLAPDVGNAMFAGCMMVVTELKPWGAQGFVQAPGENGKPGGQAYYRAVWDEMEYVGRAAWMLAQHAPEDDPDAEAHQEPAA